MCKRQIKRIENNLFDPQYKNGLLGYEALLRHLEIECHWSKIECPSCQLTLCRGELSTHMLHVCPKPQITCDKCETVVPLKNHDCVENLRVQLAAARDEIKRLTSEECKEDSFIQHFANQFQLDDI